MTRNVEEVVQNIGGQANYENYLKILATSKEDLKQISWLTLNSKSIKNGIQTQTRLKMKKYQNIMKRIRLLWNM